MNYVMENNILYRYQSGFCKKRSGDTCLSYLTDKILTGFDSGPLTRMILIYLQKAFDTINHDLITEKMSASRFPNYSVNWFKLYLSKRNFRVNIKEK